MAVQRQGTDSIPWQTNEKPQSWTDWGNNNNEKKKKVFSSVNYVPDIIPSILYVNMQIFYFNTCYCKYIYCSSFFV